MYEQNGVNNEKLIIEGRKHLSLSGVESVDGFNEQCLKLTVLGNKMQILGENIKISAFFCEASKTAQDPSLTSLFQEGFPLTAKQAAVLFLHPKLCL